MTVSTHQITLQRRTRIGTRI